MIYSNIIVIMLLFLLLFITINDLNSKNKKEKFCNCQGMNTKVCINKDEVHKLYDSGELTKKSKLVRFNQDLQYIE